MRSDQFAGPAGGELPSGGFISPAAGGACDSGAEVRNVGASTICTWAPPPELADVEGAGGVEGV